MGSLGEPTYLYQSASGECSLPMVESAEGIYFTLENGQNVLDATGGAAVSAIGHGNKRVKDAIIRQMDKVAYAHPGYFQNRPVLELADLLVKSTGGRLSRACILGSGSCLPNFSGDIISYATNLGYVQAPKRSKQQLSSLTNISLS
ncbi:hypothetical protein AWENTII_010751 [Aspergillus wentii]